MTNSSDTLFFYHRKAKSFHGDTLMPLSALKDAYPEEFEIQVQKYEGREALMRAPVIGLDCLWTDVVMFSPVHPMELRAAAEAAGHSVARHTWFKIPVSSVDPAKAIFHIAPKEQPEDLSVAHPEEFYPFSIEQFKRFQPISDEVKAYYRSVKPEEPLFYFHCVPHLLIKDTIDVSAIETIIV